MKSEIKTYKLKLYPLTPIHVGTGNTIVPGEYFLDTIIAKTKDGKEVRQNYCFAGDLGLVASGIPEINTELLKWLTENPDTWLQNANKSIELKEAFKKNAYYKIYVPEPTVMKELKDKFLERNAALEISLLHRSIKGAFIPGSSIKGAIRTAMVFRKLNDNLLTSSQMHMPSDRLERKLLADNFNIEGNVSDDVLNNLKISDTFEFNRNSCLYQTNFVGMAPLPDFRECLPPSLQASISLDFTISIKDKSFDIDELLDESFNFYSRVMDADREYWNAETKYDDRNETKKAVLQTYSEIDNIIKEKSNCGLIRLGWGVGRDAMGLNLAKDDASYEDTKTRRIFANKYPPGWALIEFVK